MKPPEIDDLLCLLMAAVVADERIFKAEINAFLIQGIKLQSTLEIEHKWSEAKLLLWYELNKDSIKIQVSGPNLKTWLYERVDRLAHIEDKAAILEAMRQIAISDDELHASEAALIILIARQWVLYPLRDPCPDHIVSPLSTGLIINPLLTEPITELAC